jgi:hypothetical protein
MSARRSGILALAILMPALAMQASASAEIWTERKCRIYRDGWLRVIAARGTAGLGTVFLERHRAFIDGGCTAPADVCPRSPEELDLANTMIVLAMNAGMASTFPPFACRAER